MADYEYVGGKTQGHGQPDGQLLAYIKGLQAVGAPVIIAEKSGCVIARRAVPGEPLQTYDGEGRKEVAGVQQVGCVVLTKAGLDGKPVLDANGHPNEWQATEEVFRRKYDVPDGKIQDGVFVKPKGGLQRFLRVYRDISICVPWGQDGEPVILTIKAGGYLNITDPCDIYGISRQDFDDTYAVSSLELAAQTEAAMRAFEANSGAGNMADLVAVATLSTLRAGGHVPPETAAILDDSVAFQRGLDEVRRLLEFEGECDKGSTLDAICEQVLSVASVVTAVGNGPYEAIAAPEQSARGREAIRQSVVVDHGMIHNMQAACQFNMVDRFADSSREKQEYLKSVGIDVSDAIRDADKAAQAAVDEHHAGER